MTRRKPASTTKKAFATVRQLHAVIGMTSPCSWDAYRAELTGFYKVDGNTLDAMARLGHYSVTASGVHFLEARP